MKLMKHITIALVLCAIPAVAAAQVTCDACTHVVSVYHGNGGFIATAAEGAEEVAWLASCNNVTRTGELTPDADGMVAVLLEGALACHGDEPGTFEIGPVMDGGWYWLTMADNSAIGGLVNKDILMNDNSVMPTDAGEGVTMTMGSGAVLLAETATGRVGILPTILPEMDMEVPEVNRCSFTGSGTDAVRETSNCMLGDGGSTLLVQGPPNLYSGMRDHIANNGTVVRPAGSVTVLVDLWGNGSGHFTTDGTGDARLGHAGGVRLAATVSAALAANGPGTGTAIDATGVAGLTFEATDSLGTLTIGPDSDYCGTDANYPASVTFTAELDPTQKTQVTPTLATTPAAQGAAARHTITIVCPSASANMGQELVPENPFPTTE